MGINRRDFLKLTAASGVLLATEAGSADAAGSRELPPGAVGILYDATLCVGCKLCMTNCKRVNVKPGGALWTKEGRSMYEFSGTDQVLDAPADLSGKTVNIIKAYREGGEASFIKRHCMHCVHAACVSACPVSAMEKDAASGIVSYDADKCIGCRYCQIACPFNIPRFEWDEAFPQIRKCQLCRHLNADGGYSACCEFCPTGASIYGKAADLRREAERRLTLKEGDTAAYPVQRIGGEKSATVQVARYERQVYGMNEVGGTQVLLMAGVPFASLGLPDLPAKAYAATSEGIQHTLYKGMIAPGIVLAGLLFAAYKGTRDE